MMDLPASLPCRNRYTSTDPDPGPSAGSSPSDSQRDQDASSSDNRRFKSGSCGSAFPARPIPSPGSQKKRSSGVITSAIIAALLDETEGSLIVIFDESHREGSLKDGSRLPSRTARGPSLVIFRRARMSSDASLHRVCLGFDVGTCGADLILEFGQPEPITNDPRWSSPSFVDLPDDQSHGGHPLPCRRSPGSESADKFPSGPCPSFPARPGRGSPERQPSDSHLPFCQIADSSAPRPPPSEIDPDNRLPFSLGGTLPRHRTPFQSSTVSRIWLSSAVGTLSLKERNRAFSRESLLSSIPLPEKLLPEIGGDAW